MINFIPKSVTLAAGLILAVSCSSEQKNGLASDMEEAIADIGKPGSPDPDASGGNTCLLEYQGKYDRLIEEADVLGATGFSKDAMETRYSKVLKNPVHHSFEYRFKNGRVGKTFGVSGEVELKDIVKVSSINPMSLKQFKDSYRIVTEQEMQAAKQALDDIAEGKSTEPDAKAALRKAEEHNISKESVKKTGGGMLDIFREVSKANTDVSGLGDAAVWNTATDDLYVLQNGVKFEIKVNVSNDEEKNKAVALEIARKILAKCN